MHYAMVIINPMARGGASGKTWPLINKILRTTDLPFDYKFIQHPGHGTEIAREAVDKGYNLVIAVGGDGTVNEVVNGIIDDNGKGQATLGVIGAGTMNDIAHTLNIPWDYVRASQLFDNFKKITIDIGAVAYTKRNKVIRRYYINTASVGFISDLLEIPPSLAKLKSINGTIPYAIGAMPKAFYYRNKELLFSIDGERRAERDFSVVVNNGRYLGGGRVFPNATPCDGLLDVAIIGDMSRLEALLNFPLIYTGTRVNRRKIAFQKARNVALDSPQRLPVQVDGELVGETPATFWVVPAALEVATRSFRG
ncbi:MAG: diacylglycerol kinase family protein [Chloroflexota bacterium]|nr:diacylglycerol kinase family protein [Chloroflexota bacterium]